MAQWFDTISTMDVVFLTSPPEPSATRTGVFWNGLSRMVSTLAATARSLPLSLSLSLSLSGFGTAPHTHHTRYSIYNVFSMVAEVTGKRAPSDDHYLFRFIHLIALFSLVALRTPLDVTHVFFKVSTAIPFWIVDHN
jgi:hypothetical protein